MLDEANEVSIAELEEDVEPVVVDEVFVFPPTVVELVDVFEVVEALVVVVVFVLAPTVVELVDVFEVVVGAVAFVAVGRSSVDGRAASERARPVRGLGKSNSSIGKLRDSQLISQELGTNRKS